MHWSIGLIVLVIVAFLAGSWVSKTYPGVIPVVG